MAQRNMKGSVIFGGVFQKHCNHPLQRLLEIPAKYSRSSSIVPALTANAPSVTLEPVYSHSPNGSASDMLKTM